MFDKYLVTGATGFLGRAVAEELVRRKAQVHALVLHDDPCINLLPKEVHTVIGDVCDKGSLSDFFADADSRTCVIHCQFRPCHTGKAKGLHHYGGLRILSGACGRRLRQEQGSCNRAGL